MTDDGVGVLRAEEQGVTVRLLARCIFGADETARAELRFDDDRLADAPGQSVAEFKKLIDAESDRMGALVKKIGIKIE